MEKIICPIKKVSPDDGSYYFVGYYDKCPWDRAGKRLLAHRAAFQDHFPAVNDAVDIGYIDIDEGKFHKLDSTTAWNWQQGAQLQWLPDADGTEKLIFNVRDGARIRAGILDPETGEKTLCGGSIYTVHPSGTFALTLNYARLYDMRRDYGISGLVDANADVFLPDNDGIFRVELNGGEPKLILSMAELHHKFCPDAPTTVKYKVNHLMFNPSGSRFCFMLRYTTPDGMGQSIFFTADADGQNVRMLRRGMISHYGWRDDQSIVAWAGDRKLLGSGKSGKYSISSMAKKMLKPIYYALGKPRILMNKIVRDNYWLLDDSPELKHRRIANAQLTTDGHCTVLPGQQWMLTDGYTDRQNRLPLFLYDLANERGVEIGRYFTPRELDRELRVDLHPRGSRDGLKVCIDSAQNGKRGIYVVDISKIKKEA